MGYRRALVLRWSRRDRLAVLVVALSVAFLVGTTLVVLAAGAQTAAIAAGYGSTGQVTLYDSTAAAEAAATDDALVLPFAEVTTATGDRTVVARPDASPFAVSLGLDGDGVTVGTLDRSATVELRGRDDAVSVEARPRSSHHVLPPEWYLAPAATIDRLGPTGALVVTPAPTAGQEGTPLLAALAFFLRGTREALAALSVAGLGAAVLVGVTLFGVTRMGVRDRLETVRIVRATGGTPRTVLGLFALRAGLLTAVGAALGYALGVILPNAAVSVAIASGQSVSLPLTLTRRSATLLLPVVVGPVVVGALAGALAARPAASRAPARIEDARTPAGPTKPGGRWRVRTLLRPRLLDRRLVVPTAATLAAFVVFATVAAGVGTALGPVATADASTVVAPGAPHPVASQVPVAYADALADEGIEASPEIMLLEVVDGRPFVAVGAEFDRYAAVHGAALAAGRTPDGPTEAVIGTTLAAVLDVTVGDRIALGGSTCERFTVVAVVGRFDSRGATASQLVVSLPTARHLGGVPDGSVNLVSAERLPEASPGSSTVGVVDVSVPGRVAANATVPVRLTLRNDGLEAGSTTVTVSYAGRTTERTVDVDPLGTRTVTVDVPAGSPGTRTVRVNGVERSLDVVEPDAIAITGLPAASPPDGRPLLQVRTVTGDPVANATVTADGQRWRTDADGLTRVAFNGTGDTAVVATAGDRTESRTVSVSPDVDRGLDVSLAVQPSAPSVLVRPTARLSLHNPWAVPVERDLGLETGESPYREAVTVAPGDTETRTVPLDRRPPGRYEVELTADGRVLAETTYTVTGDDRLAAALASSGRTGRTGLSQAIEAALGNLQLVVGVVVGLAGLMTVGATAATFAAGVHARRRTVGIHRATGAGPAGVLRLVLADALRLGLAATALGLVAGVTVVSGFSQLGVLTVVGVSVPPVPPLPVAAAIAGVALALTLLGAGLATWGVLAVSPGRLLGEGARSAATREVTDD